MMPDFPARTNALLPEGGIPAPGLAASITKAASKQTYYTVRFLVDRDLVPDAYRAYAYFRWVDDWLDRNELEKAERLDFLRRQERLVGRCLRGEQRGRLTAEEAMLVELMRGNPQQNNGLQAYIANMMKVMAFDAERRSRLISQDELSGYTRYLAMAVTEALHYFIGRRCKSPKCEARYLAATAAHITHMLRDTLEDNQAGYFNIPGEYVKSHRFDPADVYSHPYRRWVRSRVQLARAHFKAGKSYLAQVENLRCRVAGFAYIARFEGVLDAIQHDDYRLRSEYPECKSLGSGLRLFCSSFALAFTQRHTGEISHTSPAG